MEYIVAKIKESAEDGKGYFVIHNLESSCNGQTTNELNRIIHTLAITQITVEKSKGFTYVFPFKLS